MAGHHGQIMSSWNEGVGAGGKIDGVGTDAEPEILLENLEREIPDRLALIIDQPQGKQPIVAETVALPGQV